MLCCSTEKKVVRTEWKKDRWIKRNMIKTTHIHFQTKAYTIHTCIQTPIWRNIPKKATTPLNWLGFRTHFIGRPSFGSRRSLENDSVGWFYNLLFCCFFIGLFSCAFRHIIIYIWWARALHGGTFFLVRVRLPSRPWRIWNYHPHTQLFVGEPTMWIISEANSMCAIGGIRKGKQVWSGGYLRSSRTHTKSPVESSITCTHSWTHSCCRHSQPNMNNNSLEFHVSVCTELYCCWVQHVFAISSLYRFHSLSAAINGRMSKVAKDNNRLAQRI